MAVVACAAHEAGGRRALLGRDKWKTIGVGGAWMVAREKATSVMSLCYPENADHTGT